MHRVAARLCAKSESVVLAYVKASGFTERIVMTSVYLGLAGYQESFAFLRIVPSEPNRMRCGCNKPD